MDRQRARYIAEGGVSLLLILLGIALYIAAPSVVAGWAFNIPGTTDVALAPAFFPRLAAVLIVLAALSVLLTMRMRTGPLPLLDTSREAYSKAFLGAIAILVTIVLVPVTGFVVTSAVFVILVAFAGGYRNLLILVPAAIVTPIILWFVFRHGLHVGLPHGFLF